MHYVSILSAIDIEKRDRALGDLGKVREKLKDLQLSQTKMKLRL